MSSIDLISPATPTTKTAVPSSAAGTHSAAKVQPQTKSSPDIEDILELSKTAKEFYGQA